MTDRAMRPWNCAVLVLPAVVLIAAAPGGEPWQGTFEAQPVHPPQCTSPVGICTRGTLHDAATGRAVAIYEFIMLTMQPAGDGTETTFTGQSVLTKLTGAPGLLFAEDEASSHPQPSRPVALRDPRARRPRHRAFGAVARGAGRWTVRVEVFDARDTSCRMRAALDPDEHRRGHGRDHAATQRSGFLLPNLKIVPP